MKQVKGTALVEFVKTIKADKSGVYDRYLKEEDLAIIELMRNYSRILNATKPINNIMLRRTANYTIRQHF